MLQCREVRLICACENAGVQVFESAATFELPDPAVWLLGDVHGNTQWLQRALPAMKRSDPTIKTVLQLGDWWQESKPADRWAGIAGIERILVTLGNHEPYSVLSPLLASHPGRAIRVSDVVWILPRPFRFTLGGRSVLSLGGASSADADLRTPGLDWWPDEHISDAEVKKSVAGGSADVLLTHEAPNSTPIAVVREELQERARESNAHTLALLRRSRLKVDRVAEVVRPKLHVHGHLHITGSGESPDGRRVVSLGRDLDPGSIARLDTSTLDVRFLGPRHVWHRGR